MNEKRKKKNKIISYTCTVYFKKYYSMIVIHSRSLRKRKDRLAHTDVHDAFRAAIYADVISREISREGSRDKSNFLVAEVRAAEKEAP